MHQTQYSNGPNAYRILFGIQWVFAGLALMILPMFPESPYQLVAQGRIDKARANTTRLYSKNIDIDGFMASIKMDLETQLQTQNEASFKECFQGTNKLRTLIVSLHFLRFTHCHRHAAMLVKYCTYFDTFCGKSVSSKEEPG